jgi:hypothetical protein
MVYLLRRRLFCKLEMKTHFKFVPDLKKVFAFAVLFSHGDKEQN